MTLNYSVTFSVSLSLITTLWVISVAASTNVVSSSLIFSWIVSNLLLNLSLDFFFIPMAISFIFRSSIGSFFLIFLFCFVLSCYCISASLPSFISFLLAFTLWSLSDCSITYTLGSGSPVCCVCLVPLMVTCFLTWFVMFCHEFIFRSDRAVVCWSPLRPGLKSPLPVVSPYFFSFPA